MNIDTLIHRFQDAGLALTKARQPIARGRGSEDVFQMDIRRKNARDVHSEFFVVWPGHDENIVQVASIDAKVKQLVLMVKEPSRFFEEEVQPWQANSLKRQHGDRWLAELKAQAKAQRHQVVQRSGKLYLRRKTTDRKRHFLVGRDERQLFMCQLPKAVTTVQAAHDCLKAPAVTMFEGKAEGRTIRQGEWFFLNLRDIEREELERAIQHNKVAVRTKINIGSVITRPGKPHTADELIAIRLRAAGVGKDATGDGLNVFVRGGVRHADHKTVKFAQWRRVVRNREVQESGSVLGGAWID